VVAIVVEAGADDAEQGPMQRGPGIRLSGSLNWLSLQRATLYIPDANAP
jgi:hypothetical protein